MELKVLRNIMRLVVAGSVIAITLNIMLVFG
jgi:hypothetical protein